MKKPIDNWTTVAGVGRIFRPVNRIIRMNPTWQRRSFGSCSEPIRDKSDYRVLRHMMRDALAPNSVERLV